MIRVQRVTSAALARHWATLPERLHRSRPGFVPTLRSAALAAIDPRRNPFHLHAHIAHFIAIDDGVDDGRISTTREPRRAHGRDAGGFLLRGETLNDRNRLVEGRNLDVTLNMPLTLVGDRPDEVQVQESTPTRRTGCAAPRVVSSDPVAGSSIGYASWVLDEVGFSVAEFDKRPRGDAHGLEAIPEHGGQQFMIVAVQPRVASDREIDDLVVQQCPLSEPAKEGVKSPGLLDEELGPPVIAVAIVDICVHDLPQALDDLDPAMGLTDGQDLIEKAMKDTSLHRDLRPHPHQRSPIDIAIVEH